MTDTTTEAPVTTADFEVRGDEKTRSFKTFRGAREHAEKITGEKNIELQVVHTPTDALMFATTPVPAGQHFAPWQRVEVPKFAARHFDGFTPAYTRKRIGVVVYRANDHSGWMAFRAETGERWTRPNTKTMCDLTTELAKAGRAAKAEAKAAAKAAKEVAAV